MQVGFKDTCSSENRLDTLLMSAGNNGQSRKTQVGFLDNEMEIVGAGRDALYIYGFAKPNTVNMKV